MLRIFGVMWVCSGCLQRLFGFWNDLQSELGCIVFCNVGAEELVILYPSVPCCGFSMLDPNTLSNENGPNIQTRCRPP